MSKKIVYLFIFTAAVILQLSVLPVLAGGSTADGVLMLVLAWSILDGFFAFLSWSIFFGLMYDFLTYSRIGIHVLVFMATVYFVSFFSRRISVDLKGIGLVLFLLFVVVISLFSRMIFAFGLALDTGNLSGLWQTFSTPKIILLQLVYNAILFFAWFVVIRKAKEFFAVQT